jgi:glycosyltransferase involved in cell wall biosynthesis
MAAAHCGVFPARAEGWNLEALEMLSLGKTVIATNATAHTEYLTPQNARLIGMDALEPAMGGRMAGRWPAWGASQHEQLVAHLRAVHAERVAGALALNSAGISTANTYSWDASAKALLDALAHLA